MRKGETMSYQEELERLQQIVTSDDSTEEQRTVARAAREKIMDDEVAEAFNSIAARTEKYDALVGELNGVVNKIVANDLTGVADQVTALLGGLKAVAS